MWWAETLFGGEEPCGEYNVGECETLEEVIAEALRETGHGDRFVVIEARQSTDMRHEGADIIPFVRTRNRATYINSGGCACPIQASGEVA